MQFSLPPVLPRDSRLWQADDEQRAMAQQDDQHDGPLAIGQALTVATTDAPSARHDYDHGHNHNQPSSLSYAARAAQLARTPTPLLVRGDDRLLRDVTRGPPGDPPATPQQQRLRRQASASLLAAGRGGSSSKNQDRDLVRSRSRYFEEVFAVPRRRHQPRDDRHETDGAGGSGDAAATARARAVRSTAPVLVEVRTNVAVADEAVVAAALAVHVAAWYRRPAAAAAGAGVAVALQHSACLCLGGSFAPAYELAVHALPAELQPATNRRNTALLQRHLAAALGVPPARGLLRFVPVPEANLAYGGRTAAGHMEATETAVDGVDSAEGDNYDDGNDGQPEHKNRRKLSVKSLSSSFRSSAASRTPRPPHAPERATPSRSRSSSSSATAAAGGDDDPPPLLPAIPERVRKEGLLGQPGGQQGTDGIQEEEARPVMASLPPLPPPSVPSSAPSSPATATPPSGVHRQPSSSRRRVRRTKSFVATLFGRVGGGGGGSSGSNGADSRSSST